MNGLIAPTALGTDIILAGSVSNVSAWRVPENVDVVNHAMFIKLI
jgi:hypothetical protein